MLESIELLRNGNSTELHALDESLLDDIMGGYTACKKGYIVDGGHTVCSCGYDTTGQEVKMPINDGKEKITENAPEEDLP